MNFFEDLDRRLRGLPENAITLALVIAGIVALIVAMYGTPTMKAATLVWMLAP